MPKLTTTIPHKLTLMFSGGVDSHFGYHFLKNGKREIKLLHFNHSTPMADVYEYHCRAFARIENVPIEVVKISGKNECEWREERYRNCRGPVVTCHHKDDNQETFLMRGREIPPENGNILRPFLDFSKEFIYNYARRNGLMWVEDPTNTQGFTKRNRIRNELIPLMKELKCPVGG